MIEKTIADLANNFDELLDLVERDGIEILIMHRGKPCARIVPIRSKPETQKGDLDSLFKDMQDAAAADGYDGEKELLVPSVSRKPAINLDDD